MTLRIFWRIVIRLASHSAGRSGSDENHRDCKAAAESIRSSLVCKWEFQKSYSPKKCIRRGAALARIASSIVWLVCACQGCPQQRWALRAGFSFCGSTVDSARRARGRGD
jgi:hypothetical protein